MNKTKDNKVKNSVPFRMKLGFSVADIGFNIAYQTTALFLLFFFTDVFGITPAFAGAIILYSKIWDAVSDPIMGGIADKTKSRWGKFRPYLLFGAIPLGISMFLLWQSPQLSQAGRNIYGLVMFMLLSTTLTVVVVPYQAMLPTLTSDSKERTSVLGMRSVFSIIGTLIAAGATLILIDLLGGGNIRLGYSMMGLVYGLIIIALTIFCFSMVKERVQIGRTDEKISFKASMAAISKNRPFIVLLVGVLLGVTAVSMQAAVINYFFKYNLNNAGMATVAFLVLFVVAAAVGTPLFVWISKKTSKKAAYNIGMGIMAVMCLFLFFFGEKNIWLTIGMLIISGVGLATNWLCPWTMVADTIEYTEWKTGIRREGFQYGIFFLTMKVASALAGFIVGNVLAKAGYIANQAQTDLSLLGIRLNLTLIPALMFVLAIIVISFYGIDAKLHHQIIEELEASKK